MDAGLRMPNPAVGLVRRAVCLTYDSGSGGSRKAAPDQKAVRYRCQEPVPVYSHQTVDRVPHEVAIENLSLHPHIAANIAEPHSTKASVTPASSWWEIVMTHATVMIVAEGRFGRGRISWPQRQTAPR